MKARETVEREIAAILMAAVADEASQDELNKLNRILTEQPEMADFVVDLMSQEAWLSWYTAQSRSGEIRGELLEQIVQVVQSSSEQGACCETTLGESVGAGDFDVPGLPLHHPRRVHNWLVRGSGLAASLAAPLLAAPLLVASGILIGLLFSKWHNRDTLVPKDFAVTQPSGPTSGTYRARYVHGTACLWNRDSSAAFSTDDALRTGESLSLLEGLAELQLDWKGGNAALRIEGPAGLVLTAERGASLSHGRFTADIEAADGIFSLNTANGLIQVRGTASLGVAIFGSDVELHVFSGRVAFVGPWTRGGASLDPVEVNAGEAIRIAADMEGRMRIDNDTASLTGFVSKVSMGSDHLAVSSEYVKQIVAANPLVYWRFEDSDPTKIANEMGKDYHAVLAGEAERVRQGGNSSLELGGGLSDIALQSYVHCDMPLEADFSSGYTLEAWVKPSHYHWGSIVGFLGDPEQPGWRAPHGLLLEIGGPRSSDTEIEHPGRVRYLHRNPPGGDFNSGTSCFSQDAYELRKWQHVVAVKSVDQMRLYINGQLVAQGADNSSLAPGMKIIIGQLDREQFYRKFIGQIDEFAVYPRPLSEEEILRHYKTIRPSWQPPVSKLELESTATTGGASSMGSI